MRVVLVVSVVLALMVLLVRANSRNEDESDLQDNEFAEFEDFGDGAEKSEKDQSSPPRDSGEFEMDEKRSDEEDEAVVETEEDEFDTLDPEEFEGLPGDDTIWENGNDKVKRKPKKKSEPQLEIAKVPLHTRSWDKYYLEFLMSAGLAVYLMNFFLGKSKNNTIANTWMKENLGFLRSQFDLVGDDPSNKKPESTHQLSKLSEHNYSLWCSGRQCCEGMLIELKLLKRQDLVSVISNRMKSSTPDQVTITATLSDMDTFVFCAGLRKAVLNLHKNMEDLNYFCTDKARSGEKSGLLPGTLIVSELAGDLPGAILNDKVLKVLNSSENVFESLHISDQYTGPIPADQDDQAAKKTNTEKIIILTMNLPKNRNDSKDMEKVSSLLKLTIYLIDRIRKYRLSKENKQKADKHRQEATAKQLKLTHAQRQEAAQLRKEEKERALKERMMNEEDPDKQRRMDELIHRKEVSKKNKKMLKSRQYKVKGM